MSYVLMEESLFKKMMSRLLLDEEIIQSRFNEKDYWITAKDACEYLNVSKAMLYAYRRANMLSYCKIGEAYRYKRADVYKLKAQMDQELIESGNVLKCDMVIHTEEEAIKAFEKDLPEVHFRDDSTI